MNMPPKNMTSVARKIHMPIREASSCCSGSSKWCSKPAIPSAMLSDSRRVFGRCLSARIVVGLPRYDRRFFEVVGRRRRRRLPLQTGRLPWVHAGDRSVTQRPDQINEWQRITDREYGGTGARHDVENLELRRIGVIAPRHAQVAQNELRKKRQMK